MPKVKSFSRKFGREQKAKLPSDDPLVSNMLSNAMRKMATSTPREREEDPHQRAIRREYYRPEFSRRNISLRKILTPKVADEIIEAAVRGVHHRARAAQPAQALMPLVAPPGGDALPPGEFPNEDVAAVEAEIAAAAAPPGGGAGAPPHEGGRRRRRRTTRRSKKSRRRNSRRRYR